ncbi:MAG: HNH endonuclease [Mesorhizobium sp.]|nr:MAG: HNH endonuclease [Mesorhizobium sp.]
MSWGFERGRVYNRRADIHARFRGQQQGGIITPAGHNLVIIMTGEAGLDHGYADKWQADGVFEYFGEGQVGHMQMAKGNRAVAEHARNGKDLLLFEKEYPARTLRFRGAMVCEGWHHLQSPDTKGTVRQAIVFELRPLDAIVESVEALPPVQDDLATLRALAYNAAAPSTAVGSAVRTIYQRSRDVRDYVLRRAIGTCEGCCNPAPFKRPDDSPYLEPHHIRRASDGGPDDPRFVIALCPNCHRRVHSGADGASYNDALRHKMPEIECAGT